MLDAVHATDRIPLTTAGRKQLEDEIAQTEARLILLHTLLEDARSDRGADDDERADMLNLLDEHARVAARLSQLRITVENSVDISVVAGDVAEVGTLIRGKDDEGAELTYTLVSAAEAAPAAGRISVESPLGRALRGHRAGDTVDIDAPSGAWTFTIDAVSPSL